jgi:hypothetical protein
MKIQTQEPGRRPVPQPAYEAPQATFVPLKLEERLLTCGKGVGTMMCIGVESSS